MGNRALVFAASLVFVLAIPGSLWADSDSPRPKGTNVQIESTPRDLFREDKHEDDDRLVFYRDGDSSVGFNEEGDPAVGLRF